MTDFEAWLVARESSLRRLASLLSDDRHVAEDLVQVTLAKMYLAWDRLDDKERADGYARRILINEHRSLLRRLRRRPERVTDRLPETPVEPEADDGTADEVWRLVAALPPRQRAVIVLRYYEELREVEIAEVLGISTGTVKSQASRALVRLRRTTAQRQEDTR